MSGNWLWSRDEMHSYKTRHVRVLRGFLRGLRVKWYRSSVIAVRRILKQTYGNFDGSLTLVNLQSGINWEKHQDSQIRLM